MTLPRVLTQPTVAPAGTAAAPALHVVTFGCQMNKYDSLLAEGRFGKRGYRLTDSMLDADVILFNTCSVRDHAEERVYSWLGELRQAKDARPDLIIGVMGCMAQRAEEEILRRAAHVDIVCGTRQFQHLPDLVDEVRARRADREITTQAARRLLETDMASEVRVDRAGEPYRGGLVGHLAVMRGCDLNCTFCIVPTVRGRVQSRTIDELTAEARWMIDNGARVLTLLGQTVNSWGEDLPRPASDADHHSGRQGRPGLADLLRKLQELDGLERIRLITLHPAYVTQALAEAIRDCDKVDRFLPLPVQSGSDAVLKRMKRGYTLDLYRRRVDVLRNAVPDIELGSDWIVGFPGETETDLAASEAFMAEIGFVQNYVFQYDPRPGTTAADRPDEIPRAVKKERNQRLLSASERVALGRHERWIGKNASVFIEKQNRKRPELLRGRTRHNLPVSLPGSTEWIGQAIEVALEHASAYGLSGHASEPL